MPVGEREKQQEQAREQVKRLEELLEARQSPQVSQPVRSSGFHDMPFEAALFRARAFENEVREILRQDPQISQTDLVQELSTRLGEHVLPGAVSAVAKRFYAEKRTPSKRQRRQAA